MLFVGEERSDTAIKMGATWKDGVLCAKTLFRALKEANIEPKKCEFANWFEDEAQREIIRNYSLQNKIIVAMGNKVQKALIKEGIGFIPIIHPAARGKIRKTENYIQHIKEKLEGIRLDEELVLKTSKSCERLQSSNL